ncbi:acid phosphatase [Nocardioides sp. LS1]|uniref:acid phosphatase n=1 Tax=Nocardioides sp. LS1 TaxID=1027620 RepID=UPI000F61A8FA|nr:acid phosphatase [Nocardioides sp. LS1]GCD91859.1 acid phosphatase [Nocardioides sp. LS1]
MLTSRPRKVLVGTATATVLLLGSGAAMAASTHRHAPAGEPAAAAAPAATAPGHLPGGYKHLVVIYEENHSFDNLYGTWGQVHGQHVVGLSDAPKARATQVAQDGTAYSCLPQDDVNLTSPPLSSTCQDDAHGVSASHFANTPFSIDDYIKPEDKTCPAEGVYAPNGVLKDSDGAEPGGCTRDLVHRFYQEQYQIDGGKQDRYTTGSDAVGLTQGHYATKQLPIWKYLHSDGAPKYVVADHFFQGAFGGSFLNHQFLIAARAPLDTSNGASGAKNSVLDANGMPTSYPQYHATGTVLDDKLTQECAGDPALNDPVHACGDYAVNTIQPTSTPHGSGAQLPLIDDAQYPNIGDRLTGAGISWNWYSGGWDDAEAGHPGALFQYHHQPFNYFADYAPGKPGRAHLQDETNFFSAAKAGHLPTVSFVKPYGAENEHPGYASEPNGSDHLVKLLKTISRSPQADKTLVVVTYDEFGGTWDHVSPPKVDAWGPGTRVPALVLSTSLKHSGVDHTSYDTTSILATLEQSFGLAPLSSRDAGAHSLAAAVAAASK